MRLLFAVALALAFAAGCAPFAAPVEISALSVAPVSAGFTFSWQLSAPGYSRVDVWETAHPEVRREGAVRPLPGVDHRVTVAGLKPDTEYTYQIIAGREAALAEGGVRTPTATARTPPEIKISAISAKPEMTTAQVVWSTSRPTDSTVIYGRTEEFEARKVNPLETQAVEHAVALTGLEPGQAYQLKVVATDAAGEAPVTPSAPVSFTTKPRGGGEIAHIMPRQGPKTNTLVNLSQEYLKRLKSLSVAEKSQLERQIRDSAPADKIELSPEEKAELTGRPTDPADRAAFERRVDLVQRWIIHLGQQGKDIESLTNVAVMLSNRYFVAPPQAAFELDLTVKQLAGME